MWIAVTGAQGSGKSTIVKGICRGMELRGRSVSSLQGIGAYVATLNLPLGEAATRDTIATFLLEHVRRERHAPGSAVFDRCLVDLVAYADLQLGRNDPLRELVVELAQLSVKRFAAVFMTKIPADRLAISSPHESAAFRIRFEEMLTYAASTCGTKLVVLEGSVEARVARAMSIIFP